MHYSKELNTADQLIIMRFFKVYLTENESVKAKREFFNFCSRVQDFDNSVALEKAHNSALYWHIMMSSKLTIIYELFIRLLLRLLYSGKYPFYSLQSCTAYFQHCSQLSGL